MHSDIQHLLHLYGYWGILVILLLEMIGIPFPAETTLIFSGLEWANGAFNFVPLFIAAAVGNIIGSTIAYGIGHLLGRPAIVRYGRYVGITPGKLDKADHRFQKFQHWIVILSKFIAGIRVFTPYVAGINNMNFGLFSLLNAISAFLWVTLFVFIGRYVGIEWMNHYKIIYHYLYPWGLVLAIVIGIMIAIRIWYRKRYL